ncbi:MAG: lipoprotein [Cardiobacteriaceae bacterium]|nr:lipoprotein [Cardiobacteriaceae bacterium]
MIKHIIFTVCLLFITACGQKGDLYLPEEKNIPAAANLDANSQAADIQSNGEFSPVEREQNSIFDEKNTNEN